MCRVGKKESNKDKTEKCSSLQIKDKESREKRKDERLSFLSFSERT